MYAEVLVSTSYVCQQVLLMQPIGMDMCDRLLELLLGHARYARYVYELIDT